MEFDEIEYSNKVDELNAESIASTFQWKHGNARPWKGKFEWDDREVLLGEARLFANYIRMSKTNFNYPITIKIKPTLKKVEE